MSPYPAVQLLPDHYVTHKIPKRVDEPHSRSVLASAVAMHTRESAWQVSRALATPTWPGQSTPGPNFLRLKASRDPMTHLA